MGKRTGNRRGQYRVRSALLLVLAAWSANAEPLADLEDAIATRLLLMDDVARYKWNHALPVVDAEREAALLERSTADAVALGLPESYARRVLAAQIQASRALQLELVAVWQREQRPSFADVPDLNSVQRPAIDAATLQLLERLRAAPCPLARSDAQAEIATAPASLADHPAAWATATAALWPLPDRACPGWSAANHAPSAVLSPE